MRESVGMHRPGEIASVSEYEFDCDCPSLVFVSIVLCVRFCFCVGGCPYTVRLVDMPACDS